ncbi:hypothetical protein P879_05283, partial [Paragonimus westermani]
NLPFYTDKTTALDCYQDEYNPVNGHTVKTARGNCVFCVLEEWTPAPNMRSEYHTCSVHCWPYVLSNSRRICCRTNLCNNDGLSDIFLQLSNTKLQASKISEDRQADGVPSEFIQKHHCTTSIYFLSLY